MITARFAFRLSFSFTVIRFRRVVEIPFPGRDEKPLAFETGGVGGFVLERTTVGRALGLYRFSDIGLGEEAWFSSMRIRLPASCRSNRLVFRGILAHFLLGIILAV
jgi:hypothetical protein